MAKVRKVPKDKATGMPKKYLSGVKGSKRQQLASISKRISKLYKQGKKIPQTLIDRKVRLGNGK
tara:strand:+ start:699 stop:890 length:192 start_codon:yes stop_codon:yes gene_type:complete